MSTENLPNPDNDNDAYNPDLDAEDEELSSGNNRLAFILGGIMLLLIVGYVLLPKGNGSGLDGMTPSFMLDDAAVTATAPTSEDSIAAGLKAAPAGQPATVAPAAQAAKPGTATTTVATATAPATATPTAAAPAETPAAAAPAASEPEAAAPAPEPAAPANVTLSGRIADENGRPLVGATVMLKGSSKATSTDASGNYSMEVPSGENTLVYGYGGYNDEEVRTRGGQPVNVSLTPNPNSGKRKRR